MKHKSIPIEVQLEDLKKENSLLKDSLIAQKADLERLKEQKQMYVMKYRQLEKENAESKERANSLILLLVKNNIQIDWNIFPGMMNETEIKEQKKKESKMERSKCQRNEKIYQKLDVTENKSLLSLVLKQSVQYKNQKQRQVQKNCKKPSQINSSLDKLITFKEALGIGLEFRQQEQMKSNELKRQNSRKRISYRQKLKLTKN